MKLVAGAYLVKLLADRLNGGHFKIKTTDVETGVKKRLPVLFLTQHAKKAETNEVLEVPQTTEYPFDYSALRIGYIQKGEQSSEVIRCLESLISDCNRRLP